MPRPLSSSIIRRRFAMALMTAAIIPAVMEDAGARATAGLPAEALKGDIGSSTLPLTGPPASIPAPDAPLTGDIDAVDLRDGQPLTMRVVRRGREVRVRQSDGCAWSRRGDWFTPSLGWSDRGDDDAWRDGAAHVRRLASLWPMQIGAEGRWARHAVSLSGLRLVRETTCRVDGAEAVLRPSGAATPAFRVVCDEGGPRTDTTWCAPGEGPVAHVRRREAHGVDQAWLR